MPMIESPVDLGKYLLSGEVVDRHFRLTDQTVHASKNRLFLAKGNRVRDISYTHISSVELETKPTWLFVIAGIVIAAMTFVAMTFVPWNESTPLGRIFLRDDPLFTVGPPLFGISLIAIGFILKNHYIKLNVAGMSETLVLRGDKDTTNALLRLVNQRRFNLSNINSNEVGEETQTEQ